MYLENILKALKDEANVMVMLSSFTNYTDDISMQDGVGNHRVVNWLNALVDTRFENTFVVKSVDYKFVESTGIQWIITLECDKDYRTNALAISSNQWAINNMFSL